MNRTNKLKLLIATPMLLWLTLMTFSGHAQQSPDNPYIVLQVADLSPATYGAIVKDLRQVDALHVYEACVPVELIVIEIKQELTNEQSFLLAKQRISAATSLQDITLKELNVDAFRDACMAARRGIAQ